MVYRAKNKYIRGIVISVVEMMIIVAYSNIENLQK